MMSIDKRIKKIEEKYNIAGTIIFRSIVAGTLKWTLKVGEFWEDKRKEYEGDKTFKEIK